MTSSSVRQRKATEVLDRIRACLDASPWEETIDRAIRDAVADINKDQCPSTSRELIERVSKLILRILPQISEGHNHLRPSTAMDEATYLIGLCFGGSPGAGFDAALPVVVDRNAAGMETLYAKLGELLKARFRQARVNWAFARHLDPSDWETNRAVAELLLHRLNGRLPEGALPLHPELFVDCISDLYLWIQEIETLPLSVLSHGFPPTQ